MTLCSICGAPARGNRETCSRECWSALRAQRIHQTALAKQEERSRPGVIVTLKGAEILVDQGDMELALHYVWSITQAPSGLVWYAVTARGSIRLHNLILPPPPGKTVDHINLNGLDNRRHNLRLATRSEQSVNRRAKSGSSSRYRGVSWHARARKWRVQLQEGGRIASFGLYQDEEEAARVADQEALRLYGEFARLNFPDPLDTYRE